MSQVPSGPDVPEPEVVPNGTPPPVETEAPEVPQTPETPEQEYQARMSPDDLNEAVSARAAQLTAEGKSQEEITETLNAEYASQAPEPTPEEAGMVQAMTQPGEEPQFDAEAAIEATAKEGPAIEGISDKEAEKKRRDALPLSDRMVENYRGFWHDAHGNMPVELKALEAHIDKPMIAGFIPRDASNSFSYAISAARGLGKALLSVDNALLGAAGYDIDELPNPDTALGTSTNWGPGFVEAGAQWGTTALAVASGAYVAAPAATATATGFVPVLAGTAGDALAFDPRQPSLVSMAREFTGPELQAYLKEQGGLLAYAAPFVGEGADDFLKLFDPKYIVENGGSQAAARSALVVEGFMAAMTIGGFLKGIGGGVGVFDNIGKGFDPSVPRGSSIDIPGVPTEQWKRLQMELPPEIRDMPIGTEAAKEFSKYVSYVVARGVRAQQLYAEGILSMREIVSRLDDEFGMTLKEAHDAHWLEGQAILTQRAMAETDNPVTRRQARTSANAYHKPGVDQTNVFFVSPALTKEADEAIGRQAMTPTRDERLQQAYEADYKQRVKDAEAEGKPIPERATSEDEVLQRGAEVEYDQKRQSIVDEIRESRGIGDDTDAYDAKTDELVRQAVKKFEAENVNPQDYGWADAVVLNPRPWVQERLTPAEKRFWEKEVSDGLAFEMRAAGIHYKDGRIEIHDAYLADEYLGQIQSLPDVDRPRLPPSFYRDDFLDKFKDPDGNPMGTSRPNPVEGPPRKVPPGDRRLFQTDAEGNVRGEVRIDEYDEAAFITLYRTADIDTLNEEMAHVLRGQLLGPRAKHLAKGNKGTLKLDEIEKVEEHYGVVDGKWTTDQEEAFASDMRAFILDNQDSPELSKEFAWMAAHMRTVLDDAKRGGLSHELTDASDNLRAILKNKRNLPIRYGDNQYVEAVDWSSVTARIAEMEEAGEDWYTTIRPGDLLENAGLRTTIESTNEAKRYFAIAEDLAREIREKNILKRPKSDSQMRDSAYELYADLSNQDVDEAIAMLSVTNHTKQDMDDQVLTGNLILVGQAEELMELVAKADASRSVVDLALLQRKYMQFQELSNVVARMRTQTGRALRAYRWPTYMPSEKALKDDEMAREFLKQARGERKAGDPGSLAGEELVDALRGLKVQEDGRLIAENVRDANAKVGSRATAVFHEMYVNGLLASPTTNVGVSTVSPLAMLFTEGPAKLLYSGLLGTVSRQQREVFKETLANIGRYRRNLLISMRYAFKAFKQEEGVLMGASARLDDAEFTRRAISWDYDGESLWLKGTAGAVNGFGQLVRAPSRTIMTVDEFFRQWTARTHTQSELVVGSKESMLQTAQSHGHVPLVDAKGRDIDLYHPEAQKWFSQDDQVSALNKMVDDNYERIIKDGRIRNKTVLLDEARNNPEIMAEQNAVKRGFMAVEYIDREARKQMPDVVQHAEKKATDLVLQTELLDFGKKVQGILDESPYGSARVIVPFYKTPVNSFKRMAVYASPISGAAEIRIRLHRTFSGKGFTLPEDSSVLKTWKTHMGDLSSGDPRRVAEARAKQIVGSGLMLTGLELVEGNRISGAGPKDPDLRKAWMATGWRPYSIRIGETWYSYRKMDPGGGILGMVADYHEMTAQNSAYGDVREAEALHTAVICAIFAQVSDKSMLQSLDDLITIASDPNSDRATTLIDRLIVSATPGVNVLGAAQRRTDQFLDPTLREARDLVDQYRLNSLLGDTSKVPPRYDLLGRVVTKQVAETPVGVRALSLISPFEASPETKDPASLALASWGIPQTKPRETQFGLDLTTVKGIDGEWSAYDSMQMLIGLPSSDKRSIRIEYSDPTKPGKAKEYTFEELVVAFASGEFKELGDYMAATASPTDPEATQMQEAVSKWASAYRRESLSRLAGYEPAPGKRVPALIPEVEIAQNKKDLHEARIRLSYDKATGAPGGVMRRQERNIKNLEGKAADLDSALQQAQEVGGQ